MHYFFLGHTPILSLLEINSLSLKKATTISPDIAIINISDDSAKRLSTLIGGTTKIAKRITTTSPDNIFARLESLILSSATKNIAISNYSNFPFTPTHLKELKLNVLKKKKIRLLNFTAKPASLVAIKKQNATEFNIISKENDLIIAKTTFIHDFREWKKRDFEKPVRDIKSGMLSPKLARIMVNLATLGVPQILTDPFCGTGTIIMEALLTGNTGFASDIKRKAVDGTIKNLTWLTSSYHKEFTYKTSVCDATHLDTWVKHTDAIATEPYLGPLLEKNVKKQQLLNNIKGLEKLYKGALKNWQQILDEKGRVVIIIPHFNIFDTTIVPNTIDTCENLGYNIIAQASYAKPEAIITRNILILEKNGKNKTGRQH